jgi:hypothetical protein
MRRLNRDVGARRFCSGRRPGRGRVREGTLDFIYEHTKEGPNLQFHDSEQLDTKILTMFAAATAAIGVTARLPRTSGALSPFLEIAFYLAVVSWAVVVVVTVVHLWPRSHRRAVRAEELSTSKYRQESDEELKRRAIGDTRNAYSGNKDVLETKAKTLKWAGFFAAAEAILIVVALLLVRASG